MARRLHYQSDMTNQIELVVSWAGNPLKSNLHDHAEPVRVGPSGSCWFTLPEALLASDHELLTPTAGGWILNAPDGADVRVANDGVAVDAEGAHVRLALGMTAQVAVGELVFFLRPTEQVIDTTPRTTRRYSWTRWLAAAAILHAIVLGFMALMPGDVSALNGMQQADATRYIEMSLDGLERPEPEPMPLPLGDAGGEPSQAGGEQGGGESDAVAESSTDAPRRPRGAFRPTPTPVAVPTAQNVDSLGALAVLRSMSWGDDASPFSAGNARPGEGGLSDGSSLLLPSGPGFGPVDMQGTGHGTCDPTERDCGERMIDTGPLTTRGDDGHVPGFTERPDGRGPEIHPLPPQTMGSLSREQVRRTIRRHINEVRFCYEQQLQARPDLEGRVTVAFTISPDGVVQSSNVASDSTGNGQVSSCISSSVRRWTFPQAAGVTGVSYPFMLQSN